MPTERVLMRAQTILDARKRVVAKMASIPEAIEEIDRCAALPSDDPGHMDKLEHTARKSGLVLKDRNLRRKVGQYDASIENFRKYGQETVPTGNRESVVIDVKTDQISVEDREPNVAEV